MWRNTMLPVRVYVVDARVLVPVMIFILRWRLSTLYMALAGIAVFAVLEWGGLTFPAAVRILRRLLVGELRPAVPAWKKRRYA